VHDRATALNRLRAALDLAFPELLGSRRLPDRPPLLALLAACPAAAAHRPRPVRRALRPVRPVVGRPVLGGLYHAPSRAT
jgi:hypothetical protein